MLEARVIAPRGSLYFAGEATPYDLETLRQHAREYRRESPGDIALELTVDDGPERPLVTAWLGSMTAAGYRICVRRPQPRGGGTRETAD